MSEYTPTTGDVRAAYNQLITATRPHELPHEYPCPEFDRWLAQHDQEVAQAERNQIIEMLGGRRELLLDWAERASSRAYGDPFGYVEQAHTVQECIELVKKQVN